MSSLVFALLCLGVALVSIVALVATRRRNAAARKQAAAWDYLGWDEDALLQLRNALAADTGVALLRPGRPALSSVDAALAMKREFARRIAGTRRDYREAGDVEIRLLALGVDGARYSLVPVCIGRLDLDALSRSGRISCVSDPNAGRTEFAAVMSRDALRLFMLPENHHWFGPTFRWFSNLPAEVAFVAVHLVPKAPGVD